MPHSLRIAAGSKTEAYINTPTQIAQILLESFDKSALALVRRYLDHHPQVRKWIIAADFALHDQCFHGHLALNNFAVADEQLLQKINKAPEFWKLHAFSLQTAFFIVLARIFDNSRDAHSVHKLLAATVQHPEFFSKAALCARKREVSNITGPNPAWLDEYLQNITWEASTADLRTLKRTIAPHASTFEAVYRPIRTNVFAHQLLKDQALVSALFSKTLIKEMDDILRFLHDMIRALWELAYSGTRPALGVTDYGYHRRIEEIKNNTKSVLDQLL